ncbi:methyltransferase domain-containing protein [Clostridium estertheticum]|uniref:Methyltransferase domain-containing protein n=1 Tax=Clostridium estertheticum TaxID=238834 RepID=A0A5N7J3G4_9CLOT|nr:methyltransferase domain-containing protein [Clostridium estertheticum]MPQ32554.1 methyltransferase domain-containing protein [Clostridium estertheticum]MPQ63213.1 methyltransferase domain-containing protein [Clostridium estertheticum]
MKAIILNAGKNQNASSIVSGKPKCLIEIEGNTLLEIQINTLHKCGIDNITVVRGYKGEQINIPGIKYYDNQNYETTNVLHSLFNAREEMNDELLILYGDIIFEEETIKRMLESKNDIAVGVMVNWKECFSHRKTIDCDKMEMLTFDGENRVKSIGKNLKVEYENKGLFVGLIKCSYNGTEILKKNYDRVKDTNSGNLYLRNINIEKSWITDLLDEMAQLGVPLHCVIIERGWLEIDTQEDYLRALSDTKFIRRLVQIKTDWAERSETYNNIAWVNRDETLNEMVNFAGDLNNKNILDIGTGTGKVLKTLKSTSPNGNYYGVDISEEMMGKIDTSLGFKLSISKIEDLNSFKDNFFDIVTARMVLHHSENLDKALKEVYRVLKPGGKFIVCEGNPPDRHSVTFYEEMFKFKEERHTFILDDITNLMVNQKFFDITSKTIVLSDMSLNNWLNNAGVPFRNLDIIRKLHFQADMLVKKAYAMKVIDDDILMNWKFSVVAGTK